MSTEPAPLAFPAKAKRAPVAPAADKARLKAEAAKAEAAKAEAAKAEAAKAEAAKAEAAKVEAAKVEAAKVEAPNVAASISDTPISDTPISDTTPETVQMKEPKMSSKKTADFAEGLKNVAADVQAKAKEGFEKGTAALNEAGAFAKGNVEALVESGKILSTGLQGLGKDYAAEAKTAFETITADAKELAAVKSPVDFFKLQGELLRRNFDQAVAFSSKNSETVLKLATDAFAPISGRVSLAVEKAKQAA